MGEAFKRKRAARFDHQNHRHYQALVDRDLLRVSRSTDIRIEVMCRLSNMSTGLSVGSQCIVRDGPEGGYDLLHGNMTIATLPTEAAGNIQAFRRATPSFNGVVPCHVTRIGTTNGVSLELGLERANDT